MKKLLNNTSIQKKLLIIVFGIQVFVIISYTFITYWNEKNMLINSMDKSLNSGVAFLKHELGDDFHDTNINPTDYSETDYKIRSLKLDETVKKMGLKYVYSMIIRNDSIFFTFSNNSEKDYNEDNATTYFLHYSEVSDELKKAFKNNEIVYEEYTDRWGNFRSVFFPFKSGNGVNYVIGADIEIEVINAMLRESLFKNLILGLIISLIMIPLVLFFIKKIVTPIKRLAIVAEEVSKGDISQDILIESNDEIGQLLTSFNTMLQSLREKVKISQKLSLGDLNVEVNLISDKDVFSKSFASMINTFKKLMNEIQKLLDSAASGNLVLRGNENEFSGVFKDLLNSINKLIDSTSVPLKEAELTLQKLAHGDLTARMSGEYSGDFKVIKQSINKMSEQFYSAILEINKATSETESISEIVSSSTEELAAGMHEQAAQTSDVASSLEEISKTVMENSQNASYAADTAEDAGNNAREGGMVVNQTIIGMKKIANTVKKGADVVFTLGRNSEKIGEIVNVIDEIADQTNLLALNAAIEAARAGEHGRGFAVVADEVRKLAERTTKATKEIADMIKTIQNDTHSAVNAMTEGTKEVELGIDSSERAGVVLNKIISIMEKVTSSSLQVANASREQTTATEEISKNLDGINTVAQNSTQSIHQISEVAENLQNIVRNLSSLVKQFELGNIGLQKK